MSEFKVGDKVRVTLEGAVKNVLSSGKVHVGYDAQYLFIHDPEDVEKIEPPVEVFKPGDVVRDKCDGVDRLIVGNYDGSVRGWVNLSTNHFYEGNFTFTSEDYERVTLVEPPL